MNFAWYAHYTGDYGRDTGHLSLVEHGAYRVLLDHYYSTGAALPNEISTLYRVCRAFEEGERKAVDAVLAEFFELRHDGYHNKRADKELVKRAEHHSRLSAGAQKVNAIRWGNRSATRLANRPAVASPQPQPHPEPEKKNPAAKTAPPADPRYKKFYDFAFNAFRAKFGRAPSWNGKDQKTLKSFLFHQFQVTLAELQRRFGFYLESTENFTRSNGFSLAHFVARFDAFADGPLQGGGDGTGSRYESFDERRRRESAEAIREVRRNFDAMDNDVGCDVPGTPRDQSTH